VKEFATAKFNETVDASVNLVLTRAVRPAGTWLDVMQMVTGKTVRVAVFPPARTRSWPRPLALNVVGLEDLAHR